MLLLLLLLSREALVGWYCEPSELRVRNGLWTDQKDLRLCPLCLLAHWVEVEGMVGWNVTACFYPYLQVG